jgi:glycerol-3-phosphate cytidylyltransferase
MKKYKRGYTTGVYDMFHIGHLNLLKRASDQCEELIVGVTTDELVSYKNTEAIIPHDERMEIVKNIKGVSKVVSQETMDKMAAWKKLKFDVMFVGSDWKGTPTWNKYEKQFSEIGVDIVYFPYTKGTSSTKLREIILLQLKK